MSLFKSLPSGVIVGDTDTQTLTNKTLTAPALSGTVTGSPTLSGTVTVSGQGIIKGTTTNDAATAGYVGEFVTATLAVGSAASITANTSIDVTSISLTAGDWDVDGNIGWITSGGTVISLSGGINTASATLPTTGTAGMISWSTTVPAGTTYVAPTGSKRISLASTTTVYLVAYSNSIGSTVTAFGTINARRVR